MDYIDKPIIKVITGMRRVGKSTILKLLYKELQTRTKSHNIIWINKESLEFDFIQNYEDLYRFVTSKLTGRNGKKYVIIDEIQEIQSWEKAVLSILSENLADIIITGSNAHLLSSEIATLISGRYVTIPVFPLTFSEHLIFKGDNVDSLEEEFKSFIKFGGLPGIHLFDNEDAIYNYLNSIIDTLLLKDVIERNKIRDVQLLEKINIYLIDNCGNITTAKSISEFFKSQKTKVSVDTVQNYIRFLEAAFLFYRVPRFDLKGKRFLEYYDKIYLGDIGLRSGIIGYKDRDISGILENIVLLEMKKRGYKINIGVIDRKEIDFIAEKQNERIYIQVCRNLEEEKTIKREFGNLEKAPDNYRKLVLSMDKYFPSDYNGIEHKFLPDFLLNK
ncbi:MAG: ATP-binding protein [Melioribacteraceae bacterium]|nr:ATP-binding protein [Melioribacteraceae bacterium]MCF8356377.1 ATP-binding protein [Melioribacteraceae bacterium]MCF8395760.1 ATP-binding protein [Melioribacteraceae bacterium]